MTIVHFERGNFLISEPSGKGSKIPPQQICALVDYQWTKMDSDTSNPPTIHITSFSLVDWQYPIHPLNGKINQLTEHEFLNPSLRPLWLCGDSGLLNVKILRTRQSLQTICPTPVNTWNVLHIAETSLTNPENVEVVRNTNTNLALVFVFPRFSFLSFPYSSRNSV